MLIIALCNVLLPPSPCCCPSKNLNALLMQRDGNKCSFFISNFMLCVCFIKCLLKIMDYNPRRGGGNVNGPDGLM